MKQWKRVLGIMACVWCLGSAVCAAPRDETVYQVATINALMQGLYDGYVPITELLAQGDFGLGTFDHLDGEMLVLDGVCYQIRSDGSVAKVAGTVTTPFAAVTRFGADKTISLETPVTFAELEQLVEKALPQGNMFYAIKVSGEFALVKARSVPRQQTPYPALVQVVATQPVFELKETRGTLVGFRCPPFVRGLNVPGYHFHFINEARTAGGHVLDARIIRGTVTIDITPFFEMYLPQTAAFQAADLTSDKPEDLEKVEK